jgi:hypothetical protein
MSQQHTPGPWRVQDNTDYLGGQLRVDQEQFGAVAICGHRGANYIPTPTLHANARLIAAAPDLFDIVRDMVEYSAGMEYDTWRALVKRAETALIKVRLIKAEGRS